MDPVGTTGDPGVRICQYSRTGSNHIDFLINGLPAGYYTLRLVLSTPMGKERSCEGGQVISFFLVTEISKPRLQTGGSHKGVQR